MFKLDGKEYIIQNKIECDCGYNFTLKDIKELCNLNQDGFYGNIVKHYSKTNCPHCGKEIILFLKQVGQTWEIFDIAIEKENQTTKIDTRTNTEQKEIKGNEITCPVCGKVCKNQSGYSSHMKTHNK